MIEASSANKNLGVSNMRTDLNQDYSNLLMSSICELKEIPRSNAKLNDNLHEFYRKQIIIRKYNNLIISNITKASRVQCIIEQIIYNVKKQLLSDIFCQISSCPADEPEITR